MRVVKSGREMMSALKEAIDQTEVEWVDVVTKLGLDAMRNLILATPVDTGFARSNWRAALNTAPDSPIPAQKGSFAAPSADVPKIQMGDALILYNNTVYIGRLENGYSLQAPVGMVWPTYERVKGEANRLLQSLSGKKIDV